MWRGGVFEYSSVIGDDATDGTMQAPNAPLSCDVDKTQCQLECVDDLTWPTPSQIWLLLQHETVKGLSLTRVVRTFRQGLG
jgi:hypothetical protein